MDVSIRDITEILGYRITKYQRMRYGRVIDTYYHIRDKNGEVFGKPFILLDEPVHLLRAIEESLIKPRDLFKVCDVGRLR